jgi:nucleoside-diphosphate-sugar epimerase
MKTVLVAGAVGVIGRAVVEHINRIPQTRAIGLSRRKPDFQTDAEYVQVDLLDPAGAAQILGRFQDATHLVFAAYQAFSDAHEQVETNLALLRNFVSPLSASAGNLQHVGLMQGGKAYGCHLGPFPTPAKEGDPRHLPPNFYYDQEDFLREASQGQAWSWTGFRPEAVCGMAVGSPMNLLTVLGVYGSLCRRLGVPLWFPGSEASFQALYQVTDARILAKAVEWAGNTSECRGEVYNITNGDYFRWSRIWPKLAAFFGVEAGPPMPIVLSERLRSMGPLWTELVNEHRLQPYALRDIVAWDFGDAVLKTPYDNITSTIKARRHGFHECIDTEEMFIELLTDLRARRVIP